jgi:hypothetical protein
MELDIQQHLPNHFHPNAKVWIYASDRLFSISEALDIEPMLSQFVNQWKSHGTPVKGYANLFFGRFIVLMADETATGVSGCSTDSSVHLIKAIEEKFEVNMFNRQLLQFIIKNKIEQLPLSQLTYAISNGFIDGATLYFDHTIASKAALEQYWIKPAKESWLGNKFSIESK